MKILFLCSDAENPPDAGLWLQNSVEDTTFFSEKLSPKIAGHYEYLVSLGYRHIIKHDVLNVMSGNALNMHIAYLPYNRGADPNFWSVAEDTPSGVTIHVIDEGVDTGPIVAQKRVYFDDASETLRTSYSILQNEMLKLFKSVLPAAMDGRVQPQLQVGEGTFHKSKDKNRLFNSFPLGWDTALCDLRGVALTGNDKQAHLSNRQHGEGE